LKEQGWDDHEHIIMLYMMMHHGESGAFSSLQRSWRSPLSQIAEKWKFMLTKTLGVPCLAF